ncbi:MAG: dihydroorotate dehydrogenase electron transfer subunit [Bacillota bacterium]|jgi:dihydroorotate dehydrogenase electron transfer subunit
MQDVNGKVVSIQKINTNYTKMMLEVPEITKISEPGQFVHVDCGQGVYSLLRRPLSIYRVIGNDLGLLFQIKGEGTKWLADRQPGDKISLLGPLGRGFTLPSHGTIVLVAGGIGIAPLFFLTQEAIKKQLTVEFFFGAKNQDSLILADGLENLGVRLHIAMEDGSAGYQGMITDVLNKQLKNIIPQAIFACGPEPMLKSVTKIGIDTGIETQVSLEARMACGVGACRGCVTTIQREGEITLENVCSEGPVFNGREVVFHD